MSAWGKTGRVTLKKFRRYDDPKHDRTVLVDGQHAGVVVKYRGEDRWFVSLDDGDNLPTLDAAVLWVLRRVDPALWRQERGEVFRVEHASNARGWDVIEPGRAGFIPFGGWDSAIAVAQSLAYKAALR